MLGKAKFLIRATLTLLTLTLCAFVMLVVAVLTLFQRRAFYAESLATPFGRAVLRIWGVELVVHPHTVVTGQVVYISNHTSAVDVFALVALGLPNTRFFLSGYLRKLLPLGLIGYLTGIFWTVPQAYPEKRTRIFQRAARVLRESGESVYLSPEGRRVTTGEIGAFNKGAFHLATDLKAPIVPLFIHVPREVDPGMSLNAGAGSVHVYQRDPINTAHWNLDNLLENKEQVRSLYLSWIDELNRT